MARPGTGYRILDTGTQGKGWVCVGVCGGSGLIAPPPTVFQYGRWAKSYVGPKPVKNDLFHKWTPDPLGVRNGPETDPIKSCFFDK